MRLDEMEAFVAQAEREAAGLDEDDEDDADDDFDSDDDLAGKGPAGGPWNLLPLWGWCSSHSWSLQGFHLARPGCHKHDPCSHHWNMHSKLDSQP